MSGGETTTLCTCWRLQRRDGVVMGFTDHDSDLVFEDTRFQAETALGTGMLARTLGLAVDNTEVLGALSSAAITDADIAAGRLDGAEVKAWRVDWSDVGARRVIFRGSVGDLKREGGAFAADLRSMAAGLNRPVGRVFQKPCTAVLGDRACRFDTTTPGFAVEAPVVRVAGAVLMLDPQPGFVPGWFTHGLLSVLDGGAAGLSGVVKRDRDAAGRQIELWSELRAALMPGDRVRIVAGCDKRFDTCRFKFQNAANFQGFPDMPGDDWTLRTPSSETRLDGGSRR